MAIGSDLSSNFQNQNSTYRWKSPLGSHRHLKFCISKIYTILPWSPPNKSVPPPVLPSSVNSTTNHLFQGPRECWILSFPPYSCIISYQSLSRLSPNYISSLSTSLHPCSHYLRSDGWYFPPKLLQQNVSIPPVLPNPNRPPYCYHSDWPKV